MNFLPQNIKLPIKEQIELLKVEIAKTKTFKDLIKHSFDWYGLDEIKTRQVLKNKGFNVFNNKFWWEYLDILRENWEHVIALKKEIKEEEKIDARILSLYPHLIIMVDKDCWHYEGPQEVLDLISENSRKDRERSVKKFVERMRYNHSIILTPFSPKPTRGKQ